MARIYRFRATGPPRRADGPGCLGSTLALLAAVLAVLFTIGTARPYIVPDSTLAWVVDQFVCLTLAAPIVLPFMWFAVRPVFHSLRRGPVWTIDDNGLRMDGQLYQPDELTPSRIDALIQHLLRSGFVGDHAAARRDLLALHQARPSSELVYRFRAPRAPYLARLLGWRPRPHARAVRIDAHRLWVDDRWQPLDALTADDIDQLVDSLRRTAVGPIDTLCAELHARVDALADLPLDHDSLHRIRGLRSSE